MSQGRPFHSNHDKYVSICMQNRRRVGSMTFIYIANVLFRIKRFRALRFTVQIPEEYVLKLQYIKEQTNQSQQKIVLDLTNLPVER